MRTKAAATILVVAAIPAFAHRLDEYLQSTIVSVQKNRLEAQMTLTPGVAVYPLLISSIDADGDGTISPSEQRAYAAQVLRDLSIRIDERQVEPHLISFRFPPTEEMKEGRGEIHLDFDAVLPGGGRNRKLVISNHHQSRISAYQVNCLVSRDPDIQIAAQNRNYTQSFYELDYVQNGFVSVRTSLASWSGDLKWGVLAVLLFLRFAFFARRRAWRRPYAGCEQVSPAREHTVTATPDL